MKKVNIPLSLSEELIEKLKDAKYITIDENIDSGYSFTKEGKDLLIEFIDGIENTVKKQEEKGT